MSSIYSLMKSLLIALFLALPAVSVTAAPSFCVQHFNAYGPIYAPRVKSRTELMTSELMSDQPLCDVIQLIEVWNKPQIHQIISSMGAEYEANPHSWLKGNHILDYILYSSISNAPTVLQVMQGQVNLKGLGKQTLSDHYGVRVVFELQPQFLSEVSSDNLRVRLLQSISASNKLLLSQDQKVFGPYMNLLSQIYLQMSRREGLYWNYLSRSH